MAPPPRPSGAFLAAGALTVLLLGLSPFMASATYVLSVVAAYLILLNAKKSTPPPQHIASGRNACRGFC